MNKMTICKTCSNEVAKSAKTCPKCGAKLKMGLGLKVIIGIGASLILLFIVIMMTPTPEQTPANSNNITNNTENKQVASEDKLLLTNKDTVMNGHLGDFADVGIDKVLKSTFSEVKWDSFKTDNKYIVEAKCKSDSMTSTIQFLVTDDTFEIVYLDLNGSAFSNGEAEDSIMYINSLYAMYYESINDPLDRDVPINMMMYKGYK